VVADAEATVADLLLDGFAAWGEHRYEASAALLRRAIAPLAGGQPIPDSALPHFMPIITAATLLLDDSARHQIERRWVAELRDRGAVAALLLAFLAQAGAQVEEGRFADAEATLAEGRELSEATGYRAYLGGFMSAELVILAWRGREADVRSLAARLLSGAGAQGLATQLVHYALAVLELGLGNYPEGLRHALRTLPGQGRLGFGQVQEITVAGVRSGEREAAAAAVAGFAPWALASGTHWALGVLARCRALLAADDDAEPEYLLSVEHLRQCRLVPELAHSFLLYGEWLRRQRRRRDARAQLHTAWQMFAAMGMDAFAERARAELRATGEHARKRTVGTQDALTPQETQIARLAGEGLTNQEIAARLFISASTVEYHLRKIYRKLGVTTRVQLARLLSEQDTAPVPEG
jgi:DNA-binding CsgD family transcriptional regulator